MRLLDRVNLFWLGAGGLLAFFGGDELVAFKLTREPRWLGGTPALIGAVVATLAGLAVMYGLGIREPIEDVPATPEPANEGNESNAGDDLEEGA